MKPGKTLLGVLLLSATLPAAETPVEIPLWPGVAPGSEGKPAKELVARSQSGELSVSSVHQPSITPYLPAKDKATGLAILVIPGGCHRVLRRRRAGVHGEHPVRRPRRERQRFHRRRALPSRLPGPDLSGPIGRPAFLAAAYNDRPDISEGLAEVYLRFKRAGVPAELHIYGAGGHGFGLRSGNRRPAGQWITRFEEWLVESGFLRPPERPQGP